MDRVLKLAVLAQAILDAIECRDAGIELEEAEEELVFAAFSYLSAYPKLIKKLTTKNKQDLIKWKLEIEKAMGRI